MAVPLVALLFACGPAAAPPVSAPTSVASQPQSPPSQTPLDRCALAARACVDLAVSADSGRVVACMPQDVVDLYFGGRERLRSLTASISEVTVVRAVAARPTDLTAVGDRMFAIVPLTVVIRIRDIEVEKPSYLFGVSTDKGSTWKFLGGEGFTPALRQAFYPDLPSTFHLPEDKWVLRAHDDSAGPATNCSAKCTGLGSTNLAAGIRARAARARTCYNQALAKDPAIRGKISVAMRVAEDGGVCEVRVVKSDMPSEMDGCVLGVLVSARYPQPSGDCIEVMVPLAFEPSTVSSGDAGP